MRNFSFFVLFINHLFISCDFQSTKSESNIVSFELNSYELSSKARNKLDKIGELLTSDKSLKFNIKACSNPNENNIEFLTEKRANVVIDYLSSKYNCNKQLNLYSIESIGPMLGEKNHNKKYSSDLYKTVELKIIKSTDEQ